MAIKSPNRYSRRILGTAPLCLLCFLMWGCGSKYKTAKQVVTNETANSETEVDDRTTNVDTEVGTVNNRTIANAYQDVLTGQSSYIDTNNNNSEVLLTQKNKVDAYNMIAPSQVTTVDFDGDGSQECCVMMSVYNNNNSTEAYDDEYLVLHYFKGKVYGYLHEYRGMEQLSEQGTYWGSGGAADGEEYKLGFDGDKEIETAIASSVSDYSENEEVVNYYIGDKQVEEDEFDKYLDSLNKVPVTWYPYDDNSWKSLFED